MTHTLECLTVIVRFNKAHMRGQEIHHTHGPSATHFIRVEHDAVRLALHFIDNAGRTRRTLAFSSADVAEYDCENVTCKGPVQSTPTPSSGSIR